MNILFQKINKVLLTSMFLAILLLVDLIVVQKNNLHSAFGIISLVYFLLMPGYLISSLLKLKGYFGERLGYSIVLSVSFLIFLGLAINNLLPLAEIERPLSTLPFLISGNIGILILYVLRISYIKKIDFQITGPKINTLTIIYLLILFLFPLLTILGSILLNNGGSNILILIALFGICLYSLLLIIFRKYNQNFIYPLSIFFIGLSLLYMYSIRTPFLMGWDIQTEYKVFLLTKQPYQWTVLNYHNAYNATLGITILPTLLSNLINLKDFNIFKLIYPILFAFSGVGVYYILKRYVSEISAYLGSLFLIIQMSFISMPSLARQEIAYLTFVYLILSLFDNAKRNYTKHILFLILGLTIVVSHYTTTYIMLGLFLSTYIISKLLQVYSISLSKARRYLPLHKYELKFKLNGATLVVLFLFTIFWYGIYTNASGNIQNLFESVTKNIGKIQTQEGRTSQSWITIVGKERRSSVNDLSMYMDYYKREEYGYKKSIIQQYPTYQFSILTIPYSKVLKQYPAEIGLLSRQIIKILICIGIFYVLFLLLTNKKHAIDIEWILFGFLYFILIVLAIFIPKVSEQYNMERLYQQGLIFLAFYPVFLAERFYKNTSLTIRYALLLSLFVVYFFSYQGVIAQFFGGQPTMNLNNYGDEYNRYYIHETELKSAKWLDQNKQSDYIFHADTYGELRLASGTSIDYIQKHLFPSALWEKSYIYGTSENVLLNRVQTKFANTTLIYNFPLSFLKENKDVIYSNKKSIIYK